MTRDTTTRPTSTGRPLADRPHDLTPTPGQTIGPFFGYATAAEAVGLPYRGGNELVDRSRPGAVRLTGQVYDGNGDVVPDALIEIWQAAEDGSIPEETGSLNRDGYTFTGWGRDAVDRLGTYSFTTVNPGPTDRGHAPYFLMVVFARGLLNRLFTRVYLPDDAEALDEDPLLASLPADRRATLIADREPDGTLRHDIHLQGEGETVFFAYPGIDG
ncbi:protocatechuate 3,4-dioxygenase subunit alpha [Kocuria massiliensis]|uniref:protocatechuate 3,4-dioxygenase subunit alpha n=1 Tax=Kocuria massiliensis TaxID=1926282 RepID=UPI0022B9C382|nr:protocatechuate 3,4-dioxygenase subunit alpha [Kocuria massiliensis]